MSHEEEEAVKELKMRIKKDLTPAMREDSTIYYRFLKARDFDVDKAESMLRKNITWRKMYQVDTILQDFKPSELFEKCIEPSLIGWDKDGDIVLYSPTGTYSIFDVHKSVKFNNFIKHFIWFGEKQVALMEERNKQTGNCSYQATMIFNLDNVTLRNITSKLTLNLFYRFLQMYQDNYPERMKFSFVINTPSFFVYIYSLLKTVMASATLQKIHVFQRNNWMERLLDLIDADVLPAFLGGTGTDLDGNPFCRSFVKTNGKIPERFFLSDKDRYFQKGTEVEKIILSKQEKKEITIHIEEAGLLIEWEFYVRNKDIGFGISIQKSINEVQEVIPVQKYDTSDGTEKDSYKCRLPGMYIIIFDNSYSWMSSKRVEYIINIIKTSE